MKASSLRSSPDRTPSPLDTKSSLDNTTVLESKPTRSRILTIAYICAAIAVIGVLVWGAYYVGKYGLTFSVSLGIPSQQSQVTTNVSPTNAPSYTPLFSGKLTRLGQNLVLFKTLEEDTLNGVVNDFVYYSAGQFIRGELEGYTRIIAIRPSIGPDGPLSYMLATKDYQTYTLDDPDHATVRPEDDWMNPYMFLDKKKISAVTTFETEQPTTIDLDKNYALYKEEFPITNIETAKKDIHGNIVYDTPLFTDFSTYQVLSSPISYVSMYVKPYKSYQNIQELDANEKQKEQLRQTYFMGESEVVVVDSTGLPIAYALTTPEEAQGYGAKKAAYDQQVVAYNREVKKLQGQTDTVHYPQYPDYVYPPHIGFKSTQLTKLKNEKFFQTYDQAIPGACASALNTRVIKVAENELEKVGEFASIPVFRLKDTKHPLYTLAYKNKMDYYDTDGSGWEDVNKGMKKPTLEEYVSNNPLLFIQDYWHRWIALGEYDIQLPGGCGKPVIYLYPNETTDVSIAFAAPVQLTTDIPSYGGSWMVRAHVDGSLTNLKPELTVCDALPMHSGTEYAKQACRSNTYPYLYWAGNVASGTYPHMAQGFVVEKKDLSGFLATSLDAMGFTDVETRDFIQYWVPEMLQKNASYYRVSFLQTQDVNRLFPLSVHPRPDTLLRMFMDYEPLMYKPSVLPKPQVLHKIVRNGFTLVEWGGLKRP